MSVVIIEVTTDFLIFKSWFFYKFLNLNFFSPGVANPNWCLGRIWKIFQKFRPWVINCQKLRENAQNIEKSQSFDLGLGRRNLLLRNGLATPILAYFLDFKMCTPFCIFFMCPPSGFFASFPSALLSVLLCLPFYPHSFWDLGDQKTITKNLSENTCKLKWSPSFQPKHSF